MQNRERIENREQKSGRKCTEVSSQMPTNPLPTTGVLIPQICLTFFSQIQSDK
jgi:hypothetical protein